MTVKENMRFPLVRLLPELSRKEVDERIQEALVNVDLLKAIDKMPSELSGGMRKRIGLARTLIVRPEIICYDEPTTGLDPITSKEISELILAMQEKYKTTSIIITHDVACAKIIANKVLILRNGKFAVEGTFDEVSVNQDPWVKAFFS
jgi:phospholipid/cholesterol/gamma-HCH transport system ATP-binding protein